MLGSVGQCMGGDGMVKRETLVWVFGARYHMDLSGCVGRVGGWSRVG
jgi:hypothetical protein